MAGTLNGNPLVTAAGKPVLPRLRTGPQIYARMNVMGDRFRSEINPFAQERGYLAIATGAGSMFWMYTSRGPIKSIRDVRQTDGTAAPGLRPLYHKNTLHMPPNHAFIYEAHTEDDITQLIEIHKVAMEELRGHGVW